MVEEVSTKSNKTYVIQNRICWVMIVTFVISLLIILGVSIWFFFWFLDETLRLSVEAIFY